MVNRLSAAKVSLRLDEVERWAELTHAYLEHTVDPVRSFDGSVTQRTLYWTLHVKAVQSLEHGSLWRALWEQPGRLVDVVYAPAGNETPTVDEPHFVFRAYCPARPNIGGSARVRGSHEFETSFRGEQYQNPVMVTGLEEVEVGTL